MNFYFSDTIWHASNVNQVGSDQDEGIATEGNTFLFVCVCGCVHKI